MPANLPPMYFEAEKRFRTARTAEEKIQALEEMLGIMPKHKGTDKLKADLRRKIAKTKAESQQGKAGSRKEIAYSIDKEGAAQVAVIGPPNSGKSSLVAAVTSASPEVADFPHSTWKPTPGMANFEDIQFQLISSGRRHSGDPHLNLGHRIGLRRVLLLQGISLLALVLIFWISFFMFYSKVENFFVFYPQRTLDYTPQAFGLASKDIQFVSGDGKRLHGWYFPSPQKGPVVLFCHGNAGNISHRLDNIQGLRSWGLGVFIFDYRGYGRSEGSPSEKGIYEDGLSAYDYLVRVEGVSPDEIVVFGRSLGGAVALEIGLERKVRALIIESAFTSLRDMAKAMPLFRPVSALMPVHYNNIAKISSVHVPILVFHGTQDELVPFSMAEALFDAAAEPKSFYPIQGAGHNDTFIVGGQAYHQRFSAFAKDGR